MSAKVDKDAFYEEVWAVAAQIPAGRVLSYGDVARMMGRPQNPRMVGRAMCHAPARLDIPCHRVVNSAGRIAPGCPHHRAALEAEGVAFRRNGCVDMTKNRWKPEIDDI